MLPQEPGVGLGACQTGAGNPGLLSRTHANGLAVIGKADGVGLGVFEGDEGDNQVPFCAFGQVLVLGDDVVQELPVNFEVVPPLLEGDAIDLLLLLLGGDVIRVNGHHIVAALPLGLQDFQSFLAVAGGNDAVGHLPGNEGSGKRVAGIGQGHPVPKGAHPVGATGPGIGAGQRIFIQALHVLHKAGLLQLLRQRQAHSGRGGRHMLKGSGAGKACGRLQLLDQLIGVQGVQEIDIAGPSVQDGHRQLAAVGHIDLGRLLVGITAVFQFKFFHGLYPQFCG